MLLNCDVWEDSQESLGLQGDPTSPSKGNKSWKFIGRTDAEAKTPILWPPDVKNWLTGKDPGAGRDWGQEEKGMTEDEMVGWHHWLNGREFEWTPGVGDGQGGLVYCDSWGRKESDTTERLNWTDVCRWETRNRSYDHYYCCLPSKGMASGRLRLQWYLIFIGQIDWNNFLLTLKTSL